MVVIGESRIKIFDSWLKEKRGRESRERERERGEERE